MMNSVFPNKTRRPVVTVVVQLLVLVLVALANVAPPFISSTRAASQNNLVGVWTGAGRQGLLGRFDMTLTIPSVDQNNSFTGTLREDKFRTTMNVRGTINGNQILFRSISRKNGNQMVVGTRYTGTVSNGAINNGRWTLPIGGNGPFQLTKQGSTSSTQ